MKPQSRDDNLALGTKDLPHSDKNPTGKPQRNANHSRYILYTILYMYTILYTVCIQYVVALLGRYCTDDYTYMYIICYVCA